MKLKSLRLQMRYSLDPAGIEAFDDPDVPASFLALFEGFDDCSIDIWALALQEAEE